MTELSGTLSPIDAAEARMKNPLILAYIGDTVFDLFCRTDAVKRSAAGVNAINRAVCGRVNAHAQSLAIERLEPLLTDEESGVYHRGRNAKSGTSPKNMDIRDYRRATGLEAVFGFLFLAGRYERLEELFGLITQKDNSGE